MAPKFGAIFVACSSAGSARHIGSLACDELSTPVVQKHTCPLIVGVGRMPDHANVKTSLALWNIIYQNLRMRRLAWWMGRFKKSASWEERYDCYRSECAEPIRIQRLPLDAIDHRRHLYGYDGQSSVRLDLFRRSDGESPFLGSRQHPGRIQHLHRT